MEVKNIIWRKLSAEKVSEMGRITKARTPILGLADVATAIRVCREEVVWLLILVEINSSMLAGMKAQAPHTIVAIRDRLASPLAAIAKKPPHMATLAEVMAPVVTTMSLLRTIGAADVIQITANNLRIVREAIGRRPHLMAVVESVTPLAIKMGGLAPMAPLGVSMIVMTPSAETMDPIHKTLTASPLDVVIMTEVRLVVMGALGRLHMVEIVALGVANTITNHHLILGARGKILLPMVVRNKHFPTGAPAMMRG